MKGSTVRVRLSPLGASSGLRLLQTVIAGDHLHGYSLDFERYLGELAG